MKRAYLAFPLILACLTTRAEVIDVDNAELARLQAAGVPLVDIRTAAEWTESGIVPGSHLLTFFDERGRSEAAAWLGKLKEIAGPAQPVAVICRSGNRTRVVSRFLSDQAGYATVYNVRSGIRGWIGEQRAVAELARAASVCSKASAC